VSVFLCLFHGCYCFQSIVDNCTRLCRCHGNGDDAENDCAAVAGAKTNGSAVMNGYSGITFGGDSERNDSSLIINALMDIVAVGLQSNYMCSLLAKVSQLESLLLIL